jgi:hypothetical protein
MSKNVKRPSKEARTDLVCIYWEMVGNGVLMVASSLGKLNQSTQ